MTARLKGRPFTFFGINSDRGSDVPERMKKEGITWPSIMQGSTSGPISRRWNVTAWPTIYVLDHKGVIRFRGLRGKRLEDAVMTLLKQAEADAEKPESTPGAPKPPAPKSPDGGEDFATRPLGEPRS